jgi:hypothetical protein
VTRPDIKDVTVSFEPYRAGLFAIADSLLSDLFFVAEPLDLGYDEPNAVAAAEETEFVLMSDAIYGVEIPASPAAPMREQPAIEPLRQRNAA